MGFFDFLRKSNEKEVLVETLKLSEVEFFLDKKLEELNHKLGLSIQQTKTEISEEISRLKNNLENLANAELKNKEIKANHGREQANIYSENKHAY